MLNLGNFEREFPIKRKNHQRKYKTKINCYSAFMFTVQ